MRRFVTAALLALALVLGGYYVMFYSNIDLGLRHLFCDDTVSVPFRTEGTQLQVWDGSAYAPLVLRGVDVSSSLPGEYATAFAADEEDYLRWFGQIGEMGANAVRAVTVMDDDFYNALYAYNTSHEQPLYLLQGTSVPDAAGNGAQDAYSKDFLGSLLQDGKTLVDIIHGRKNLLSSGIRGSGSYRKDISPWVAGWLVGTEWYPDTISYTDHSAVCPDSYTGTYFATCEGSTPFEAMLAQVMEEITAYESGKYQSQRPAGFLCSPDCDFLEYEEIYARQLQKHAHVDPEHVQPAEEMKAGCFAAYRLYDFCEDFPARLTAQQQAELGPLLTGLNAEQPYGGYLHLLAKYHTMPVLAAGYGFSSARGAVKLGQPPLTEPEQGARLAEVSRALEAEGWAGGFISTWQDVWERRTWNTAFAAVPTRNYLWHDLQTDGQNYGLLAFASGDEPVCTLDGDPSEWSAEDMVLENGGLRLSARCDAEGLYLLLQGTGPDTPVYIPLGLAPGCGSRSCDRPALTFARETEFLLCVDGTENTRLLVQERRNAMRENFLYETSGDDPFIEFPARESGTFVPVTMALENHLLLDTLTPEGRAQQRLGVWETGRLTHGCGDPEAAEYHSLADFCFGEGCVELRLPWLLLNVGDPSAMAVHEDYYEHYGVEFQSIRQLWLGISKGDGSIPMEPFRVKGWGTRVTYRERLKQSYYVMQALWKGGGSDGNAG